MSAETPPIVFPVASTSLDGYSSSTLHSIFAQNLPEGGVIAVLLLKSWSVTLGLTICICWRRKSRTLMAELYLNE